MSQLALQPSHPVEKSGWRLGAGSHGLQCFLQVQVDFVSQPGTLAQEP
ncbi:MAG: hypothetical protein WCP21_12975 [Armatimonadota bacterium]